MDIALVALLYRTADRVPNSGEASEALATELGDLAGLHARLIGTPAPSRSARYDDDLRDSRGGLLEAGGQVDDALCAGLRPVIIAGDCSIALTTLPVVARHHPTRSSCGSTPTPTSTRPRRPRRATSVGWASPARAACGTPV
jgi:hypothetical protein